MNSQENILIRRNENGKDRVKLVDGVMIIAFSQICSKYILVQNNRTSRMKNGSLEFPGGKIEKNETARKAAHRELIEETGYNGKLKFLQYIYSAPAVLNSRLNVFITQDIYKVQPAEDPKKIVMLSYQELCKYPFEDAAALACVKILKDYLEEIFE